MGAMNTRRPVLVFTAVIAWGLLFGPAPPQAAEQDGPYYPDEALCEAIFRLADSARTHSRSVKYRAGRGAIALPQCQHDGSPAGRKLCELLGEKASQVAIPPLALDALFCIGVREPTSDEPDAIMGHSFWTAGTFKSEPPHFAEGTVRIEISLDGREKTSRPWIGVAAIPLR